MYIAEDEAKLDVKKFFEYDSLVGGPLEPIVFLISVHKFSVENGKKTFVK